MNNIENIFVSSEIIYLVLIPILRGLAGILLAVAISKDCKARDNGNGALWGLFTLITPAFAGIIYCIYSRILIKRKGKTNKDKKKIKQSKKLTISAIIIYLFAIILAIVCIITGVASGIAYSISNDGTSINALSYDEYYDMNGKKYDEARKVILYDKNGKAYHIDEDSNGWNYYPYYDEMGNKYDLDKCYISKDGYLYYDENESLVADKHSLLMREYDIVFHDSDGNEYKLIGNYAFFNKDGKIIINHMGRHGYMNIYAFE